jgi:hypothetical protein
MQEGVWPHSVIRARAKSRIFQMEGKPVGQDDRPSGNEGKSRPGRSKTQEDVKSPTNLTIDMSRNTR